MFCKCLRCLKRIKWPKWNCSSLIMLSDKSVLIFFPLNLIFALSLFLEYVGQTKSLLIPKHRRQLIFLSGYSTILIEFNSYVFGCLAKIAQRSFNSNSQGNPTVFLSFFEVCSARCWLDCWFFFKRSWLLRMGSKVF